MLIMMEQSVHGQLISGWVRVRSLWHHIFGQMNMALQVVDDQMITRVSCLMAEPQLTAGGFQFPLVESA